MSLESEYIPQPTPPDKMNRIMKVFFKYRGRKTICRASLNMKASDLNLSGLILDLGAGGERQYSYYELLRLKENSQVIAVDISKDNHPQVVANLEKGLPFKSSSANYVLMFNLLEHMYDFRDLCSEAYRVLQRDGTLYIFVPFLFPLHADPCDYFRYTGYALHRLLKESGFSKVEVENLGLGPLTTSYFTGAFMLRILQKPICWPILYACYSIDRMIDYMRRKLKIPYPSSSYRLPISYFVTGIKEDSR